MTKPETLFEQASFELNQFRERRMADRRAVARDTPDRRKQPGMPPQNTAAGNGSTPAAGSSQPN